MRILHISTRLILGGSQENTVLSCEGQARLGHDVHLAFGPIYGPEGSLLERVRGFVCRGAEGARGAAHERRITTHEVPDMIRELHPVRDFKAYRQLRRLIREVKPDIVHTHSSKAGVIGRAAAWMEGGRDGRVGVVHTVHGPPFHEYEKAWRNAVYVHAERFAAKRCHRIVCVAAAMREQFLMHGIGTAEQYDIVYSGCETEEFLRPRMGETREEVRAAMGLSAGDVVIGTVARLAELKGHDDLLEALGEDLKRNPSWKLLWVGDGWWRERLTARLAAMGLSGRVVMSGLVAPGKVPGLIRAMDVLVHPSYREGLPRAVVQGLLCGVPVVAYDVDGTGEVVRDRTTGRLVRAGDIAGLREAIGWMIERREEARRTAERGRAECAERFSAGAMVEGLERVYARARTPSVL
ncbi:MAG TPA: glycosyltransferase family 4 protein [Phycisphaerales bacterium]|nr:glycosyltransferase family 4 protein [Phycisphaerales bacterium]